MDPKPLGRLSAIGNGRLSNPKKQIDYAVWSIVFMIGCMLSYRPAVARVIAGERTGCVP